MGEQVPPVQTPLAANIGGGPTDYNDADDFNILITGFAPFKTQFPVNPSWEIASSLPPSLLYRDVALPTSNYRTINLLIHPKPIRVNYDTVRTLVPQLYSGRRIDYTLHIGMAASRHYYSLESSAHKHGYTMSDVDGKLCSISDDGRKFDIPPSPVSSSRSSTNGDETSGAVMERDEREDRETYLMWGQGPQTHEDWTSVPRHIRPDVDIEAVMMDWKKSLPEQDLRRTCDAGRYLCEWIFYCSLAHCYLQKRIGNVAFLHVPAGCQEWDIKRGVNIVEALVAALAKEYYGRGGINDGDVRPLVAESKPHTGGRNPIGDDYGPYVGGGSVTQR